MRLDTSAVRRSSVQNLPRSEAPRRGALAPGGEADRGGGGGGRGGLAGELRRLTEEVLSWQAGVKSEAMRLHRDLGDLPVVCDDLRGLLGT